MIMNREQQAAHKQRVINNLNQALFHVEMSIQKGPTGKELQILERTRTRIETKLMVHYGTEKYDIVHN
jgi:hypothetical protein